MGHGISNIINSRVNVSIYITCCFDEILKNDPKNGDAYYNKARIKALQNDLVVSLHLLKKAIEINSDYRKTAKDEPAFCKIKEWSLL